MTTITTANAHKPLTRDEITELYQWTYEFGARNAAGYLLTCGQLTYAVVEASRTLGIGLALKASIGSGPTTARVARFGEATAELEYSAPEWQQLIPRVRHDLLALRQWYAGQQHEAARARQAAVAAALAEMQEAQK